MNKFFNENSEVLKMLFGEGVRFAQSHGASAYNYFRKGNGGGGGPSQPRKGSAQRSRRSRRAAMQSGGGLPSGQLLMTEASLVPFSRPSFMTAAGHPAYADGYESHDGVRLVGRSQLCDIGVRDINAQYKWGALMNYQTHTGNVPWRIFIHPTCMGSLRLSAFAELYDAYVVRHVRFTVLPSCSSANPYVYSLALSLDPTHSIVDSDLSASTFSRLGEYAHSIVAPYRSTANFEYNYRGEDTWWTHGTDSGDPESVYQMMLYGLNRTTEDGDQSYGIVYIDWVVDFYGACSEGGVARESSPRTEGVTTGGNPKLPDSGVKDDLDATATAPIPARTGLHRDGPRAPWVRK